MKSRFSISPLFFLRAVLALVIAAGMIGAFGFAAHSYRKSIDSTSTTQYVIVAGDSISKIAASQMGKTVKLRTRMQALYAANLRYVASPLRIGDVLGVPEHPVKYIEHAGTGTLDFFLPPALMLVASVAFVLLVGMTYRLEHWRLKNSLKTAREKFLEATKEIARLKEVDLHNKQRLELQLSPDVAAGAVLSLNQSPALFWSLVSRIMTQELWMSLKGMAYGQAMGSFLRQMITFYANNLVYGDLAGMRLVVYALLEHMPPVAPDVYRALPEGIKETICASLFAAKPFGGYTFDKLDGKLREIVDLVMSSSVVFSVASAEHARLTAPA